MSATWLIQHHVVASAEPYLYGLREVPTAECILVPGARIYPDGRPFPMLIDRLEMAKQLHDLGKAPRILVSGRGGGGRHLDEVGAMRRWLIEHGIPENAIQDDREGLRTIDSLRRCQRTFGYRSVIVTSNDFHVSRMVFLAHHYGLSAYGVSAPPLFEYSTLTLWKNRGREIMARVRACVDVYLLSDS